MLAYIDDSRDTQKLRIETDTDVLWDVDRVTLTPVVTTRKLKTWVSILLGAALALAGRIVADLLVTST